MIDHSKGQADVQQSLNSLIKSLTLEGWKRNGSLKLRIGWSTRKLAEDQTCKTSMQTGRWSDGFSHYWHCSGQNRWLHSERS